MQIPASNLPLIKISGTNPEDEQQLSLLHLILSSLEREGLQVTVISGDVSHNYPGDRQNKMKDVLQKADLVFFTGTTGLESAHLFLGSTAADRADATRSDNPDYPCFTCAGERDLSICVNHMLGWLSICLTRTPVWGAVLIGGKSSRMGTPKHLLTDATGKTWLERTIASLEPWVENIVISGAGEVPLSAVKYQRISDIPGVSGPLAGIGALFREQPLLSWVLLACDMPDVTQASIEWLLQQRKPGRVGVIPRSRFDHRSQPLFAWYNYRSAPLITDMIGKGEMRVSKLCEYDKIYQPVIPEALNGAWRNVNRPEQRNLKS